VTRTPSAPSPSTGYTVTGSKNGFVDAIFGQKRPLQQGTPVTVTR